MVLKARDSKNMVLENEAKNADLTIHDSGRVELRSETSVLRMDSNVNLLDAGDSGINKFLTASDLGDESVAAPPQAGEGAR